MKSSGKVVVTETMRNGGVSKWVVEATFNGVKNRKVVYAKTRRGAALSFEAGNASGEAEAVPTEAELVNVAWGNPRTAHAVYGVYGPIVEQTVKVELSRASMSIIIEALETELDCTRDSLADERASFHDCPTDTRLRDIASLDSQAQALEVLIGQLINAGGVK